MNKQSGFSLLILPILIVVVAIVAFAGLKVMSKNDSDMLGSDVATSQSENSTEQSVVNCSQPNIASALFTAAPIDTETVKSVNSGKITGDGRFLYVWNKQGAAVNIYAPADGTLFKIRHIVNPQGMIHDDYGLFFMSDCGYQYRFNHITDPRSDILAAYPAGDQPSADDYDTGGMDVPSRVEPITKIKVKAGELLGSTTGTPQAHNFDIAVGNSNNIAVCMFDLYSEPLKTKLLNLLSPEKNGEPVPGTPCEIATSPGY